MSLNKITSKDQNDFSDDFTIDQDDDSSICTLIEGDVPIEGDILRSFSFNDSNELIEVLPNSSASENAALNSTIPLASLSLNTASTNGKTSTNSLDEKTILDHRISKANPNGRTPSVDGEIFDMVRTYTLRRSTVRILSKIKAIHIDDNVYLNTIVDEAIRYYYDYLKNNLKDI